MQIIGIIVVCTVDVVTVLVSLLVALSNSKLLLNRMFLVVAACAALWTSASILSFVSTVPDVVRVTSNSAAALGYVLLLSCFLFSEVFRYDRLPRWVVFGLLPASVPLTGLFASDYACGVIDSSNNCVGGPAYNFLYLCILVLLALVIKNCVGIIRHATPKKAQQAKIMLWGLAGGTLFGAILAYVPPRLHVSAFNNYYSLAPLIFIGATFYAIIRHSLFDIRLFVLRAAAYTMSVGLITAFYLLPAVWLITRIAHIHMNVLQALAFAVASWLMIAIYGYVRRRFDRLTTRIFYRDFYDSQDVLDDLSDLLVRTIDIGQVQVGSQKLLLGAIRASSLMYWIDEKEAADRFKPFFRRSEEIVIMDELQTASAKAMRDEGIAVIVQLRTTRGELGYMTLGFKESGQPYTTQDKRLLTTAADEIAISMQNALHFEEIQNFNKTLQGKVEHATKELRRTNDKLKALDETKDEFITMASHQLRTPLTSVKGYLSMVLEGDAGKLNDNQRKLLEQSYMSSQRMVYLISDLLNLSRLNTGKFVIEPGPVDLSEVVQAEVDQLAETAKARGLSLTYERPADFPVLMLDETKTHQIVMNLIDNAIYYTPAGGKVTVGLRETPGAVEYTVRDTGIGVPRNIQHKLFTKFYRARNAQQARPDGTGLGLFMVKKVVAAQGGSIIFESEENKGSTFGFRFGKAQHAVPPPLDSVGPAAVQPAGRAPAAAVPEA